VLSGRFIKISISQFSYRQLHSQVFIARL